MEVKEVLHMNDGDGDFSYAEHSRFAQMIAAATKPIVESVVSSLFSGSDAPHHKKLLHVADLGCAAGPNTFLLMKTVIDTVKRSCSTLQIEPRPEIQFYLNDLQGNDFNSLFKGLASFGDEEHDTQSKNKREWFVVATAGSFHGRLFPSKTLHLVHSSYSVHWLSKIPSRLKDQEGLPVNKGCIYISGTSSPAVKSAYLDQFREDFTLFLKSRSSELVRNGRVLLILQGRQTDSDTDGSLVWDMLTQAVNHVISLGIVEAEKLDSFNVPYYIASTDEVRAIVEEEGSFSIQLLETLVMDAFVKPSCHHNYDNLAVMEYWAEKGANNIRSFTEPLLCHHFGKGAMNPIYDELTQLCIQDFKLGKDHKLTTLVIVLRRL